MKLISNQDIHQEKPRQRTVEINKTHEKDTVKPKINLSRCEKNYSCVAFCPRNAISINQKGWPTVDNSLCDGCFICLRECPVSAISEEKKNDE
jgi:Pyruvate/2-oxoacid:ferredoxin oxidoreductase delta subunit